MQQIKSKADIIHIDLSSELHRASFYNLNTEWLEKYFYVEEIDKLILSQPEKIIKNGGFILFAKYEGRIVGTISLIKAEDGEFELSKLAVTEEYKGLSFGKKLMDELIKQSKSLDIDKLYIASNRKLLPAISLYEKFGFVESKEDRHSCFERGNITMELKL